jgi:hypothetical protein
MRREDEEPLDLGLTLSYRFSRCVRWDCKAAAGGVTECSRKVGLAARGALVRCRYDYGGQVGDRKEAF